MARQLWIRPVLLALAGILAFSVLLAYTQSQSALGLGLAAPRPVPLVPTATPVSTGSHPAIAALPPTPQPKQVTIPQQAPPISDGYSSLQMTNKGQVALVGVQPQVSMSVSSANVDRFNGVIQVTLIITNLSCTSISFGTQFNAGGSSGSCVDASAYYTDSVLFVSDTTGYRPVRAAQTPLTPFVLTQGNSQTISLQYRIDPNVALGTAHLVYMPNGFGQRVGVFRLE